MAKTQNKNSTAELRALYQNHDTLGISTFLDKHRSDPKFAKLYSQTGGHFEDAYVKIGRYLEDNRSLKQVQGQIKKFSTETKNSFIEKIKKLKSDYQTGVLPADKIYSQLRALETDFEQFSDVFYGLYGELELLATTKMEDETTDRVEKRG
tara:strand:- start:4697 stop:5149 length:453 start_codon:yes stop_codon:yes gene_type:complete